MKQTIEGRAVGILMADGSRTASDGEIPEGRHRQGDGGRPKLIVAPKVGGAVLCRTASR